MAAGNARVIQTNTASTRMICDECGQVARSIYFDKDIPDGRCIEPCGHNASVRFVPIETEEN